jgi:predicted component of type VI protein secretion system
MAQRIRLRGMNGNVEGRTWAASSGFRVGRLTSLELPLSDHSLSRRHAEFRLSDNGWVVRDLGSRNGTFLNGTKLAGGEWPIKNFDVIRFCRVTMVVEIFESADVEESGIVSGPVESFPISIAESISGNSDCPTFTEVAPPHTGNHPALWKVTIPGNRPLATPAIANGRVFVGGGFGSHEFYAFSAKTGEKLMDPRQPSSRKTLWPSTPGAYSKS